MFQSLTKRMLLAHLLCANLVCAPFALAETNASGDQIELLDESASQANQADALQILIASSDIEDSANAEEDLWARIRNGYNMPEVESEYTANHEAWYAARPDYVKRMTERSQKYLFHIVEEVQKRGMPTEIALLPMIESAFNPQAYSRSHASGIWQFVPATGKDFGLKQNWWVDNRRDVTAATNAALNYLQKLHGMFGAWDLALAAYNAGEGTVQRAIDRNRNLGLPTDYAHLNLPAETKNYVPKLQAVKNIITEPEKYGMDIQPIANRPYFLRVTAPKQIDSKLAAKLAEVSYDEFIALNPGYNRPVITSNGEVHHLLLPTWAADRFAQNLATYDKPLTNWQTYYAKRGERMDNIARKFGINTAELRNVNDLPNRNKFRYPQTLLVPSKYSVASKPQIDVNANYVAPKEPENRPRFIKTSGKASNKRLNYNKQSRFSARAKSRFVAKSAAKYAVGRSSSHRVSARKSSVRAHHSSSRKRTSSRIKIR